MQKRQFVLSTTTSSSSLSAMLLSKKIVSLLLLLVIVDKYDVIHAFTTTIKTHSPSIVQWKPSILQPPPLLLQRISTSTAVRWRQRTNTLPFLQQQQQQRSMIIPIPTTTMMMMTINENEVSLLNDVNHQLNDELDRILLTSSSNKGNNSLTSPSRLRQAITFLQEHANTIQLNKSNWDHIFTTIEDLTAELAMIDMENNNPNNNSNNNNDNASSTVEFPIQGTIRQDMTDMYQLLATLPLMSSSTSNTSSSSSLTLPETVPNNVMEPTLRLFGAVSTTDPPASYIPTNPNSNNNNNNNYILSPQLFEQILNVPMSALTPSSSNTLLYVGMAVAILEGIVSLYTGINYNFIVGCTLLFVLFDRIFLNGISMETIFKVISPELQQRIYHHEAGHFLCAYLLGCPIESIVVSAYAALQDPRFRYRPSFTAGTSFFDPILSEQMNASIQTPSQTTTSTTTSGVTRSSIDRYSMIVMAGIAAEADQYGQADGGASDEYALIAFLSQLRSNSQRKNSNNSGIGTWDSEQIRNQARYGAVQAMLLLRQYRPAYDALVQALQYGGTLKDCIYAIEQAGRKHQLPTKYDRQPVGYIVNNNNNNDDDAAAWIPNTHNSTSTLIHNLLVRK